MIAICKRPATECVRTSGDLTGMQIAIRLIPGQKWHCAVDDKYFFVWIQPNIKFRITKHAFNRFFEIMKEDENGKA